MLASRIALGFGLWSVVVMGCGATTQRSDDAGHDASTSMDTSVTTDAGRDSPTSDAAVVDTHVADTYLADTYRTDATAPSCGPDRVEQTSCNGSFCEAAPRWYWNGDRCLRIACGACVGDDCSAGFDDEAACVAAHAGCEAPACRATGGTWRWWAHDCGHFVCGERPEENCLVGQPSCDCGRGRAFDLARGGCVDAECPELVRPPRNILCTSSGGTWAATCCDAVCGEPCPLACAADACDCGEGRVFDDARGCVEATRCYEPAMGDPCLLRSARCEGDGICCPACGGAGCVGTPRCRAPVCDSDPRIDVCGNNLLAP